MSEYVFLYRGGETGRSPERIQQSMQKWMAWFKELGQNGHIKDQGQPLERTGKVVKGHQKTVTDGPFAEAKDIVGGYTLIGYFRMFCPLTASVRFQVDPSSAIDPVNGAGVA
ncbi:MAG TPA: hypothetical protein VN620_04690 [Candidatus Methylomirabilis sp.]|nr:hypothetical protein [Candidatus Methylomirabilis sp.]